MKIILKTKYLKYFLSRLQESIKSDFYLFIVKMQRIRKIKIRKDKNKRRL